MVSVTGYEFGGWCVDEACTTAYDFNSAVTSDLTLYGKTTVIEYEIIFKNVDPETGNISIYDDLTIIFTIESGNIDITDVTPDEALDYNFIGWFNYSDNKMYKQGEQITIYHGMHFEAMYK